MESARVISQHVCAYCGKPEAPPFESVQTTLRERLPRQALHERVESWVREQREGADIRRNPQSE